MAQSMSKYFAVWFGFALVLGLLLFFLNGTGESLNPAIHELRLQNCQTSGGGFSGDQSQECLSQVERALSVLAGETRSDLMFWFAMNALAVLLIGLLFVVRITQRNASAGSPADFRSMYGSWFAHLIFIAIACVLFGAIAHFGSFFGAWALVLSPARALGIPALMLAAWCLAFWLGTKLATPDKMKPSIPLG